MGRKGKKSAAPEEESLSCQLRHVSLEYPYKQLEAATNNFDRAYRLGEGSAGTVFRAELQDGSYAAVKVIDLGALGDNALVAGFEDEVMILSKFRHPNLVVLMGWAREGERRFLVYEFLSGGDVSGRLRKSRAGSKPFLWHERLSVCRDAATGLAHLHNASRRAFHRDIKSANILIGDSCAKMADFGLSCVAHTMTAGAVDCQFASGTPGYACPIYMSTGKVTEGSEVYSFGMVLLEVLLNLVPAGMLGTQMKYPIREMVLPGSPGAAERAVAAADAAAGWPPPVARDVAELGLACIDNNEARRPTFNVICKRLRALQEQFPPNFIMGLPMQMPGAASGSGLQGSVPLTGGPVAAPRPPMVMVSGTGAFHPHGPVGLALPAGGLQFQPGPPPGACGRPPGVLYGPPPGAAFPGQPFAAPGMPLQQPPGPCPTPPFGARPSLPAATAGGWPGQTHGAPVAAVAVRPGMTAYAGPPPGGHPLQWQMLPPGHMQVVTRPLMPPPATGMAPGPQALASALPGPVLVGGQPAPPAGGVYINEVLLEVASVRGVPLNALRQELRTPLLMPSFDGEGRRRLRVGRACQPQWFEALLAEAADLEAVASEAFELCWGGPELGQAAAELRLVGLAAEPPLVVDGAALAPGAPRPLRPGSSVSFCRRPPGGGAELDFVLTLVVHRRSWMPCGPEMTLEVAAAPLPQVPPEPPAAPPTSWHLECIYVEGKQVSAVPAERRRLQFDPGEGFELGRQHLESFELVRDAEFLKFVSRRHFRLELLKGEAAAAAAAAADEATPGSAPAGPPPPRLLVTNLSQNAALVSDKPLQQGQTAEAQDGDTLVFAHTSAEAPPAPGEGQDAASAGTTVRYTTFLTMRLVGPPPPPTASPYVLQPGSSLVVLGLPPEEAPDSRPPSPIAAAAPPRPARLSAGATEGLQRLVVSAHKPAAIDISDRESSHNGSGLLQPGSPASETVPASVPKTMPLASLPPRGDRHTDVLGDSFDKTRATACWGASALPMGGVPKAASTQPLVKADAGQCAVM